MDRVEIHPRAVHDSIADLALVDAYIAGRCSLPKQSSVNREMTSDK
jgi:hypothetical protein